MTTTPKPLAAPVSPAPDAAEIAEPAGTIRLKLAALGIDHRAPDFPARFIEFCEQNDRYEMEVNAAGELLILPMTGFRGNQEESYFANYFLIGMASLPTAAASASQTSQVPPALR